MAEAHYTITITRWYLLRITPGAWLVAVRTLGIPAWHPRALWLLLCTLWCVARPRRST